MQLPTVCVDTTNLAGFGDEIQGYVNPNTFYKKHMKLALQKIHEMSIKNVHKLSNKVKSLNSL